MKAWDCDLDDAEASGRSLEMIERAIAVNPALARLGTTEKLKTIVEGAKPVEDSLPLERDILKAVEQERTRHVKEKAEIDQKIAQLQRHWEREVQVMKDEQEQKARSIEEVMLTPQLRNIETIKYVVLWASRPPR